MRQHACERVAKSEFRSQAQAVEKAGNGAPQSDEVIAAVGARTEHRVRGAQFFKRQAQQGGGKCWRVRTDNHRPRMPRKKFREGPTEPPRQVAAPLPSALEDSRNRLLL